MRVEYGDLWVGELEPRVLIPGDGQICMNHVGPIWPIREGNRKSRVRKASHSAADAKQKITKDVNHKTAVALYSGR